MKRLVYSIPTFPRALPRALYHVAKQMLAQTNGKLVLRRDTPELEWLKRVAYNNMAGARRLLRLVETHDEVKIWLD